MWYDRGRKKRELSVHEILHFIQIVELLKETIQIMDDIDKIIIFFTFINV